MKTSNLEDKTSVSPLSLAITAALAVSNPLSAANFNVTQAIDNGDDAVSGSLSWAIRQANVAAGDDTITLTSDVTVQSVMTNLINSNVVIEGNSYTVSGNSQFRPFFVLSGTVTLRDLTVSDGRAKGGDGSGMGGGGAGLGGALFVYDGTVRVENVTFSNNAAVGGNSGTGSSRCGGGMGDGCGLFSGDYGGNGNYGGGSGADVHGADGECADGSYSRGDSVSGGNGGFGGAGGNGFGGDTCEYPPGGPPGGAGRGGRGGFGGGGGYGQGGSPVGAGGGGFGGFGGGGGGGGGSFGSSSGSGGFGGGDGGTWSSTAGGGDGFGGALFAKKGTVKLNNVAFNNNSASGGNGAEGRGGAIFICTANEGDSECNAVINDCGNNSFSGNTATTGENDTFGTLNSDDCESTLVTLSDFQVNSDENGVELTWRTVTELDNAGFNVWRRVPGGFWEKVNDSLILAQGDNSSYSFVDSAGQDFEYRLEDIDQFDHSTFHYPAGAAPVITLKSPADGAVFGPSSVPVFKWEAMDYEGFSFQYAYPGSGIQSLPWSPLMEFEPAAELWASFAQQLRGETVYWRIKGKFGSSEENYSDVWHLIVEE